MDDKATNKMLALLVFISSAATALSLGMLAYVFVMGNLPFGIQSISNDVQRRNEAILAEKAKVNKVQAPSETDNKLRPDEEYLASFAAELKKEKEKIAAERADLNNQRKSADDIVKQATELQAKVEAKEKEVKDMIQSVSDQERRNVDDIQKLIVGMSGTDTAQSLSLLLSFNDEMAARILYSMNKKTASKLVSTALKGAKEQAERITIITKKMQTLPDSLKEEAPK